MIGAPNYMRIVRMGNEWYQLYSENGSSWRVAAHFFHTMTTARAGVFGATAGSPAPAHTAQFDYVFNTASPIVPEDAPGSAQTFSLTTSVTGSGSIARSPNGTTFGCGAAVSLTATPAPGWAFSGWSGALSGNQNPASVVMSQDRSVQANFTQIPVPVPPVISNIQVTPAPTSLLVTWTTDRPAVSIVDYGPTVSYGSTRQNSTFNTSHSVLLTGLSASSTYHYRVTSIASDGGTTVSSDRTATTAPDPSGFVSDDFNVCAIDEGSGGWTFVDPLGGTTHRIVGTGSGEAWLEISVPAGVGHDAWNTSYNSPRLMRAIANTDFEIEARFTSPLTAGYQLQGIFIEQDPLNYLRFEFHHDGDGIKIFAARTVNGVSGAMHHETALVGATQIMRIRRQGNEWIQTYSADGDTWREAARFVQTMTAAKAGVFGANAGASAPAHTAKVDYIFSTASPLMVR